MADDHVPFGFCFYPTNQELVGYLLHTFLVERKSLMPLYSNFIRACNLFGNKLEPSDIWNKYGGPQLVDQELYFRSGLKKLTPKLMDRSIGHDGTWSETESSKLVEDANGNPNPIGQKRKFRYENHGSEEHTWWLLDEYSRFVGPKNDYNARSYDFDFVICQMRKNDRPKSKETNLKLSSLDRVQKKRSTNKKMKKDHQMGSTESSSHVLQGCSSSRTGGDLVATDPTFFQDSPIFDIEQILGETQVQEEAFSPSDSEIVASYDVDPTTFNIGETRVEEVCNPSNFEDVGNPSLVDSSYCNWTQSYMDEWLVYEILILQVIAVDEYICTTILIGFSFSS